MKDARKGFFALLGAALIYSLVGLWIRLLDVMWGNYSQVAARFFVAFLIVSGIIYFSDKKNKLASKQWILSVFLGIGTGLLVTFFTLAVTRVKIADTIFVFYAGSIISSFVFGTFMYKESINLKKVLMISLAVLGFYVYVGFSITVGFGILMALFAGFFDGGTNAIRKKLKGADKYQIMKVQFFAMSFVGLITALYFSSEPIIKEISVMPIVVLFVFALLAVKLNDLLLYGFSHYDVNIGTIVLASEVFFTSAVGYIFFAETLNLNEWVGGGYNFYCFNHWWCGI